jgi:very-short-patch-repair endonuclease
LFISLRCSSVVTTDQELFALARAQHGVVATRQLLALGMSRGRVSTLSSRGWLQAAHRGVYLVGPIHGPRARLMAATLAGGDAAMLSHRSGGELWAVGPALSGAVSVTLVGRGGRSRPGITVHVARRLSDEDVTSHDGIPVTAPGRTLLDLATQLPRRDLARAVEQAEMLGLVHGDWLDPLLTRNPRHRGAAALRAGTRAADAPAMTRSEAERRLLELVRAARLPPPRTNQRIHGHEVDFVWSEHRLVAEVDGFAFHSSRSSFERDRRRDAHLVANGYRVVRITWRQLTTEPESVVALLARALAS